MNLRSIFTKKKSGEDRADDQTNMPTSSTPGPRGWRRGLQGIPLTLLTQEPRDGGCPHRSKGRRTRRQESRGVATTVSRTTFASRPTKVPAPPGERRCHTGHDDPGLQPADLLRRHTEQQKINVIPIKTAVAVHPTRIARRTSARWTSFCMQAPGFGSISKQTCQKCRRANSGVLIMELPQKYVSEGDSEKEAPLVEPPMRCQTERPEDLPSGRELCPEKIKGTGAATG